MFNIFVTFFYTNQTMSDVAKPARRHGVNINLSVEQQPMVESTTDAPASNIPRVAR